MKIDIDLDTLDGVVRSALKRHLKCVRNPKYPSKNQEDIEYEKELCKALKFVIKHYGG